MKHFYRNLIATGMSRLLKFYCTDLVVLSAIFFSFQVYRHDEISNVATDIINKL